jgi:hypothetical protein
MPAEKPAWQRELDRLESPAARAWHDALEALRAINAQPVGGVLFGPLRYDGFDHAIAKEIGMAADWIDDFRERFHGRDNQRRRACTRRKRARCVEPGRLTEWNAVFQRGRSLIPQSS